MSFEPMSFRVPLTDQQNGWKVAMQVRQALRQALLAVAGLEAIEIIIRPYRPKRTSKQRKTLFFLHGQVAAEITIRTGEVVSSEDIHEMFIERFMPRVPMPTLEKGAEIQYRAKRTSEATRAENAAAMDAYIAWAVGDMGFELKHPDTGQALEPPPPDAPPGWFKEAG